ncbi:NACHT domain-containing protein [Streptomyces pactum]|uniref:NACHT domain-containing protein n=1 Tax=Streptomyces pactum TaxID=68249 RepID=A0ABS0NKP9_9ACTN|nr:NACHT domain-containing protein [Streptomyces pactum]MBH5335687.1 NACHT domain-containing protein [Streptomyces pactum]
MDPAVVGARLASGVVAPLVRKLFVTEGPGAGVADRPVRISSLVSFTGEKRTLTEKDLHKLARKLVERAVAAAGPGERPCPADEEAAVTDALARTLAVLGELDMDDVQAVRLGHRTLVLRLVNLALDQGLALDLSWDATEFYRSLLETACLHILHFFTQRSTFVARTLLEQSRQLDELTEKIDRLLERDPPSADARFEARYGEYIATKHGTLSIVGLDLDRSQASWALDTAYLSLRAVSREETAGDGLGADGPPRPADQALAGHRRVLLRGVAGSGKTTLVQWLAVAAARARPPAGLEQLTGRVPFVIPLRTAIRAGALPTPDGFLAAVRNPLHGAQPDGWAHRVLDAGRGLLLIDGMDEIPEPERERARAWLEDLLIAYPGNLWLVTSRPTAVADDWLADQGFTELELAPMGRDDTAAFITRWHDAALATCRTDDERERIPGYRDALLTAVTAKADLTGLATNPLMCGLICALHRARRGYLPPGRKELYDAALLMLLERRDRERDIFTTGDVQLPAETQIQLLQRLAYWLIRNGQSEMDTEQAERVLAEALPSVAAAQVLGGATQVLAHLLLRSGLLRRPSWNTVDFVHRTFQDYLGAKAAVEHGDFGLLVNNAHDSQWEDVVRMAVAHARPRERAELLTRLLDRADRTPELRTRLHLLAAACLEHAPDLDPAVRDAVKAEAAWEVPPVTAAEARALAEIGPLTLELLPTRAELDRMREELRTLGHLPDPCAPRTRDPHGPHDSYGPHGPHGPQGPDDPYAPYEACVITATLIGTDAALPYLRDFADHPYLPVRSQLSASWGRFDTARYHAEVVSRLAPDDLYFTAETPEQLRLLLADGRRMLMLRGDFPADRLRALLPGGEITHLRLDRNPSLSDLAVLDHLAGLRALVLTRCGPATDLSPVAGLGLHSLDWAPPAPRPLPEGLEKLTGLRQLRLTLPGPSTPPALLPRLDRLELDVFHPELDVPTLVACFPGLRHLRIAFRTYRSNPEKGRIDLAPLASLPGLRQLFLANAEVTGAEQLAGVGVTVHDRPPRLTGLPTEPAAPL